MEDEQPRTVHTDRAAADALVGELRDNGWTTAAVTYAEIMPTGRVSKGIKRNAYWRFFCTVIMAVSPA
jgi:hypothetical protein